MDPVIKPVSEPVIATVIDRAALDAFVDGALTPEEAARVVLHLADCPADQAYVDAVMETNALLAAAYCDPLHEAAPERLRATIFPGAAAEPARPRFLAGWRAAPRRRRLLWGALAATFALAVGLGLAPRRDEGGALVGAELRAALETSPSGAQVETAAGATITLVASFRDAAGRPCRQYDIVDVAAGALTEGVACRAAAGWTPEIAVSTRLAGANGGDAYVPAAGAGADALEAALDRLGAGMTLSAAEEQALLAAAPAD